MAACSAPTPVLCCCLLSGVETEDESKSENAQPLVQSDNLQRRKLQEGRECECFSCNCPV